MCNVGREERGRAEFSHIALPMCHCRKVTASLLTPLARRPRERAALYNRALSGPLHTWQGSHTSDYYFLQTNSFSALQHPQKPSVPWGWRVAEPTAEMMLLLDYSPSSPWLSRCHHVPTRPALSSVFSFSDSCRHQTLNLESCKKKSQALQERQHDGRVESR